MSIGRKRNRGVDGEGGARVEVVLGVARRVEVHLPRESSRSRLAKPYRLCSPPDNTVLGVARRVVVHLPQETER